MGRIITDCESAARIGHKRYDPCQERRISTRARKKKYRKNYIIIDYFSFIIVATSTSRRTRLVWASPIKSFNNPISSMTFFGRLSLHRFIRNGVNPLTRHIGILQVVFNALGCLLNELLPCNLVKHLLVLVTAPSPTCSREAATASVAAC
ncbi:hypothetical protein BDR05DRAFT_284656 [Suillus weaverae]|nr:hypothetical protein BDR05DRAFT_284656 [Suillus weaverae]